MSPDLSSIFMVDEVAGRKLFPRCLRSHLPGACNGCVGTMLLNAMEDKIEIQMTLEIEKG